MRPQQRLYQKMYMTMQLLMQQSVFQVATVIFCGVLRKNMFYYSQSYF